MKKTIWIAVLSVLALSQSTFASDLGQTTNRISSNGVKCDLMTAKRLPASQSSVQAQGKSVARGTEGSSQN